MLKKKQTSNQINWKEKKSGIDAVPGLTEEVLRTNRSLKAESMKLAELN